MSKTKVIKGVVAGLSLVGALGLTYKSTPAPAANAAKGHKGEEILITSPEKTTDYGLGTYRVEGFVPKGAEISVYLDRKQMDSFKANTEDGSYVYDFKIDKSGDHMVAIQYQGADGKGVMRKLDFSASDMKNIIRDAGGEAEKAKPEPKVSEHDQQKEEETPKKINDDALNMLPEDNGGDVVYPEDPSDPNSAEHRKENGVKDDKKAPAKTDVKKPAPAKKAAPAKKPTVAKKPAAAVKNAPFAISSHSNFNVIKHGLVKIGGKGRPGDKVVVLVDNKPAMKGTIKPNGRWSFPVKISTPGYRVVTAQNLSNKQSKTIKLKVN
ncbi:MAG: hypothetical protein JST12_04915 [Armatimonadetes bacterium]|nr:hypothetical protein [Armatimonadota bacterium]